MTDDLAAAAGRSADEVLDDLGWWVTQSDARGNPVSHLELGEGIVVAVGAQRLDEWCAERSLTWHEVGTL